MKKILISAVIVVMMLCISSCQKNIEYDSLLLIIKDATFDNAYEELICLDHTYSVKYNDLKEQDFYKNIMNSKVESVEVLPEMLPLWSLIIYSDDSKLQIDCLGSLYAKYEEKWYKIKCSNEDIMAFSSYLPTYQICEKEGHTWDDGFVLEIPESNDKEFIQTCIRCREERTTIIVAGVKYKLTVMGNTDFLLNSLNKEYYPGFIMEIKMDVLNDADIEIYANNEKLKKTHYDSDYWGYSFEMPNEDVILEIKVVDGFIG